MAKQQVSSTSNKPTVKDYKNNKVYLEDNYIYISHLDEKLQY